MNALIDYLLQFGKLNAEEINLVQSKFYAVIIQKGDYFSEAGKTAKQIAFIKSGIIRVCFFNNKGDEITRYFLDENNFAVDLNSYNTQIPSSEYLQAVSTCELFVITREQMEELSEAIPNWDDIISKIIAKALVEKVTRISPMLSEDASTRYLNFLKQYPKLANRIPLSMLASYLGITQSSLSRIRRSI